MGIDNKTQYVWHPYTQMGTAPEPIHIDRGEGALLFDIEGKTYIDAIASWWVNIHGHAHPKIAKAIADQAMKLEQVIFAGFTHSPALDLAEKLIHTLPPYFSKVFFSDNGSTSVEVAIKMALQYWHNKGDFKKKIILSLEDAYHGDTFGAMSVSAPSAFNGAFHDHLFEVVHLTQADANNIAQLKQQIAERAKTGTVAAFIFEPLVQGAGGMKMHKAEVLDELILCAQQNGILCIADEVMTGFGRTGKNFAIEHLKSKVDLVCLSKGITGGFLPLGVTICTAEIYDAFYSSDRKKTFFHGHSYTANPLACAAANASLDILLSADCQNKIRLLTESLSAFGREIEHKPFVQNVRQAGCIFAFEINTQEPTSYFNQINTSASKFFLERGVLIRPLGNVFYLMPPYCISEEQLKKVYATLLEFISQIDPQQVKTH